jgi:hypothetical protein
METLKVPGTGERPRPRQIGDGDGGANLPGTGARLRFWQIGDGGSVGSVPNSGKSGTGAQSRWGLGAWSPVQVLGQIGDGDGNGDRGVRALLGGLAIRDLAYHL